MKMDEVVRDLGQPIFVQASVRAEGLPVLPWALSVREAEREQPVLPWALSSVREMDWANLSIGYIFLGKSLSNALQASKNHKNLEKQRFFQL